MPQAPPEQLSGLDASFLYLEHDGFTMNIGGLVVLEPVEGAPALSVDRLRARVSARLVRYPRLRQRLAGVPLDLARPLWVDDPRFDVSRHVLDEPLPAGADWAQLLRVVERTHHEPLDRDRPLWELRLLHGLASRQVVVHVRLHHALADGMRGMALTIGMFDEPDDAPAPAYVAASDAVTTSAVVPAPDAVPAPTRPVDDLVTEAAAAAYARRLGGSLGVLADAVDPLPALRRERQRIDELLAFLAVPPPPRAPFVADVGPLRRHATAMLDGDQLTVIRRRYAVSAHDTVLGIVAGGLARLFNAQGRRHTAVRTLVPMARPLGQGRQPVGNHTAFCFVDLPCGPGPDADRLAAVAAAAAAAKRSSQLTGSAALIALADDDLPAVNAAAVRTAARLDGAGLVVSYLRRPRRLSTFLGYRHVVSYPMMPLAERIGVFVGVLELDGRLGIGVTADPMVLPSPGFLAEAFRQTADALLAAAPA